MTRLMTLIAVAMLSVALIGSTAVAAPVAAPTQSAKIKKIYKQCDKPKKLKKHSKKQLRKALRKMPKDVKQYTTCEPAIKKAIRNKNKK